jgi:SAM-dependent methyltransferase
MQAKYVFEDAATERELSRLRALEAVFDPATQRCLLATGQWQGRSCLEVGAGAGSIAAWMQQQVGPTGRVVAVDTTLRLLGALPPSIELVEGDVRQLSWQAESFDVVHVRYVLVHNAGPQRFVERLCSVLKPGGWLLLEEPDFTVAHAFAGPAPLVEAFARIKQAIAVMFGTRGLDPALGSNLGELVQQRGLAIRSLEADASVERGGSPLAAMMSLSAEQLADKYVATGCVTNDDVARFREFASDPACWASYYSTVRVLARKCTHETPKS